MDDLDLGKTIVGLTTGQKLFNRYTLKKTLGRGGMGVVWLAHDEELGLELALKFLPEIVSSDRTAVEELKREVRRALHLAHPNIVKIHGFLTDGHTSAVAMEYVAGDTLAHLRADEPGQVFAPEKIAPWIAQLCAALDYAHGDARVVHRDLKPSNLMVDRAGRLKVMDFGIAASLSESVSRVSNRASTSGSPGYMSPQQWRGLDPTESDDLYALGTTLYEMLTGQTPFKSPQPAALMHQVLNEAPQGLNQRRAKAGQPAVPPEWEETIMALLAKEPADRPQSAGEVAECLGLSTKDTKSTKQRTEDRKVERGVPPRSEPVQPVRHSLGDGGRSGSTSDQSKIDNRKSKIPIFGGLAASVVLLGGLGWYFGVHAPGQRQIELARLEAQRAEAGRLATARGGLIVRTEPGGAEVILGGVGIEKSPATFKELRLGQYEVTVRKQGYEDQVLKLTVEENRFVEPPLVLLKPLVGAVTLTTDPPGLDFELTSTELVAADGLGPSRRAGKTPANLSDLMVGSYRLVFRRDGWPEQSANVNVSRWQPARVTGDFSGGGLKLATDPAGLKWVFTTLPPGVKPLASSGQTPYEFKELPVGKYSIEFRREGGWAPVRRDIEVLRGQSTSAAADFVPGSLLVESTPAGADVVIDGKVAGRTPLRLPEVLPGAGEVELKLRGHKPATLRGTIEPRRELRLSANLEKHLFPQPGQPWENTLGQKFAPVPGTGVLFCVWEAREQDYAAFVAATGRAWQNANAGPDHPAVNVSWDDAQAFCHWLTERERTEGKLGPDQSYRLPTDAEWSVAVGLREGGGTPQSKDAAIKGEYPWGAQWPPPRGAGNYADENAKRKNLNWTVISGYDDGYAGTAPVGSFTANRLGLHDLGGNVFEWCEDFYNGSSGARVLRGASFGADNPGYLLSSMRGVFTPDFRLNYVGFRVVVAVGSAR